MRLVSVSEAAETLGLSEETVRARLKAGTWRSYRFGDRSVRIDLDEIIEISRRDNSNSCVDHQQ